MKHVLGNRKAIAVFLLPALIIYLAVMVVPVVWSFVLTGMDGSPVLGFHWVGWENFTHFFRDPTALHALGFTIKYAVVLSVLQIVVAYLLAILYVFVLKRLSTFVRTMVFFPVVLPSVAISLLFSRLFAVAPQIGPVNSVLELFGANAVDWFATGDNAFIVIIIMDLWRTMGFYAVLLYAGLVEIPVEVLDAARVDGAGGVRLVRHIVLPASLPVLLSTVIFSLNNCLKVFDSILALNNGGPGTATTPLNLYMFQTSFLYSDYGYGSVLALLITVLCLAVTLLIFRSSRRDLTEG
ncbi:MAG: sugar ABC transporter permease [Propionibacteriaceae bacterium]|jgi:multiple sugar transport system permease protein/raffinose/stachyose/melibiose transport system permease protein|nr:sugar ABC transporter permease [Propionibacteriaceae bacterium]